jgi:hypothetical protein
MRILMTKLVQRSQNRGLNPPALLLRHLLQLYTQQLRPQTRHFSSLKSLASPMTKNHKQIVMRATTLLVQLQALQAMLLEVQRTPVRARTVRKKTGNSLVHNFAFDQRR